MAAISPRTRIGAAALGAASAAAAFASYPLGASAFIAAFFAVVLVTIAAIDLRTLTIPNRLVLPATAIVLAAHSVFFPGRALEYVLAALLAGAALLLPHLLSSSWMGMGDVKLGLLLGAALGRGVWGALMLAFLAAFPFSLVMLVRSRSSEREGVLPFGPFMALGGLIVLLGPPLVGLGGVR
jgi:leader peptidase (prepilin peptidase)/N-methyltransferase